MDEETERELFIERQINQKQLYSEFPKFKRNFFQSFIFSFAEQLNGTFKEKGMELAKAYAELFVLSGSAVEGALNARNMNPINVTNKCYEGELDIMFPFTKILRNKSREVIIDLEHAKGFTWIKYKPECFNSSQKFDGFLIKHEDGNIYLNSEAVKNRLRNSGSSIPEVHLFKQEIIKGPSANLELELSQIEIPGKVTLTEVINALQECVRFIENASEYLERFHCDVSLKLKELEKLVQGNHELISFTNVNELASRVLPTKKERKNILLEVHWMLLALINETLSAVFIIDKMLPKQDLIERLGMFRIIYHATFTPLSNPKELFESLDSYFKDLLYLMPKEVYQKYNKSPLDGLFHFLQKCRYCQQDKMEKLFQFLSNCKSNLLRTSARIELFRGSLRGELDVDAKFNKLSFSLDRVPAITVEDFPYIASEWVTRDRKWPPLSVVKDIVMSGCHIVPKPYYGKEGDNLLDWRWSFSVAETTLASFRTREMDTSYLILKSVFYRYLKPIEYDKETLASYFMKTVMLWQCEENDETWWSDNSIVKCVSILLNRLKISFFNKHLSHYFIREINLFDNVADELVLYGQAILESICADPIVCIEEVLKFYDDEKLETSNETISETCLEDKLNMPLLIAEGQKKLEKIKEKYKDETQPKIPEEMMKMFEIMYNELLPKLFLEVPTENVSEANYLKDSEINFHHLIKVIKSGLSADIDIPLD